MEFVRVAQTVKKTVGASDFSGDSARSSQKLVAISDKLVVWLTQMDLEVAAALGLHQTSPSP